MKAYGERRQSSNNFEPKYYMELSGQLHVRVIFLVVNPAKEDSCGPNALDRKVLSSLPRIGPRFQMSTRDFSWGEDGQCIRLTTYHPRSAERRENPVP